MLTNESQVRLTVQCRGRLASTGANSTNAKMRKKRFYVLQSGKKWHNEFQAPTFQECHECVTINPETVQNWISEEGCPLCLHMPVTAWKKLSKMQRLMANLQVHADFLAGARNAKYTFEIIN